MEYVLLKIVTSCLYEKLLIKEVLARCMLY